jgi:hypothetical protein
MEKDTEFLDEKITNESTYKDGKIVYKNHDLMKGIEKIVKEELNYGIRKYGENHSLHEGFAVMLEEFEELQEDTDLICYIKINLKTIWNNIKYNNLTLSNKNKIKDLDYCRDKAKEIVFEGIQFIAMIDKFKMNIPEEEGEDEK